MWKDLRRYFISIHFSAMESHYHAHLTCLFATIWQRKEIKIKEVVEVKETGGERKERQREQ